MVIMYVITFCLVDKHICGDFCWVNWEKHHYSCSMYRWTKQRFCVMSTEFPILPWLLAAVGYNVHNILCGKMVANNRKWWCIALYDTMQYIILTYVSQEIRIAKQQNVFMEFEITHLWERIRIILTFIICECLYYLVCDAMRVDRTH